MKSPMTLEDAQAKAAEFIEIRRAQYGDLRMEDTGSGSGAPEGTPAGGTNGDTPVVEKPAAEEKPEVPTLTPEEIAELVAARDERDALKQAQMTEAEKVAESARKAEERAVKAEREAARYKVAAEKGVPAQLIAGDDEKAMRASADALIEFAKKTGGSTGPIVDPSQGSRETKLVSSADEGRAEAQRRIAARNARTPKS